MFQLNFFKLCCFISTFSCVVSIVNSYEEELANAASDYLVQHLVDKYKHDSYNDHEHFWHPYVYGSVNEHREVVKITNIELDSINGHYTEWQHARLGLYHLLLGLTNQNLDIYTTEKHKSYTIQNPDPSVAFDVFTVYTKWDDEYGGSYMVIVIITSKPAVLIYKATNTSAVEIGNWQLNYKVKDIQHCHVLESTKLLLTPKHNHNIEVYGIETYKNESNFRYLQRLDINGYETVAATCFELIPENVIAVSSPSNYSFIQIYYHVQSTGLYRVHQTLPSNHECRQLVSFTVAFKPYLACVPTPDKYIEFFSFNGTYYNSETRVGKHQARELFPAKLEVYRDEPVLITQDIARESQFLVFDFNQNAFKNGFVCNASHPCPPKVNVSRSASYENYNGDTVCILPSAEGSNHATILIIHKIFQHGSKSPVYTQSRQFYNQFTKEAERFNKWKAAITAATTALSNSLSLTNENVITGNWHVNYLSGDKVELTSNETAYEDGIENHVITDSLKTFTFVNQHWRQPDFDAIGKLHMIQQQLHFLDEKLQEAKYNLSDALLKTSHELQIVTAPMTVHSHFHSSVFHGENVFMEHIWGQEKTSQFLESLYIRNSNYKIHGELIFHSLMSASSLQVDTFNNEHPENIARHSAENIFQCDIEFRSPFIVEGDMDVKSIEGHDIPNGLVMVDKIKDCKFVDGLMAERTIIENFYFAFDNIMLSTKDQVVMSQITFEEVHLEKDSVAHIVNKKHYKSVVENIVLSSHSGAITTPLNVLGRFSSKSIRSIDILNSHLFPQDYVENMQHEVVCTGVKHFSHLSADQVKVTGLLNGVNITDSWVGLHNPMVIHANWTFKSNVTTEKDFFVKGKVDGVNMEDLKHHQIMNEYRESYVIHADVEFEQAIKTEHVEVTSKINDKDHMQMFEGVLMFDGPKCHIPGETVVKGSLYVDDLHVADHQVNKHHLDSFMTLNTPQNITGHMNFMGATEFSALHTEVFDTVQLSTLTRDTIRLSNPGTITSKLHFENLHVKGHFSTGENATINGQPTFSTLVAVITGRDRQEFVGKPITFDHLKSNELEVTYRMNMTKGRTIGGVDIMKWYNTRIDLEANQKFKNHVIIDGDVECPNVLVDRVNGVLLEDLMTNTLRKDQKVHNFIEEMFIESLEVFGNVHWKGLVDGMPLEKIKSLAIPLNSKKPIHFSKDWHFENISIANNLVVHGSTCGESVEALDKDIVKKGENNVVIGGKKTFSSGLTVGNRLETKAINGDRRFFENLVTLGTPQNIVQHMEFKKNITVTGDLEMEMLNGVAIEDICRAYSFDNGNTHVINHDVEMAGDLRANNFIIDGKIQNRNTSDWFKNIVTTDGGPIHISGTKDFLEHVTVEGAVNAIKINNIDLRQLASCVIMTNANQTVFRQPVTFENIQCRQINLNGSDFQSQYLPYGVDLKYLYDNAVHINGEGYNNSRYNKGNLHFSEIFLEQDFQVNKLNGHTIKDYITLHTEQYIPALTVENIHFSGSDVNVQGLVDKYNLRNEYANTLMSDSRNTQYVRGSTYFDGNIFVKENLVCKNEEQRQSTNDIVTLHNNYTIYGPLYFSKPLHVRTLNVTHKVSGHTMDEYLTEPFRYSADQEMDSFWTFEAGVTFEEDVVGDGKLDDYDMREIINEIKRNVSFAEQRVENHIREFEDQCSTLNDIAQQLSDSAIQLDYFDIHQTIILQNQADKVITVKTQKEFFLLAFMQSCEILKYIWNTEKELFYLQSRLNSTEQRLGYVKNWQSVLWNDISILVYATQPPRPYGCSSVPERLYFTTVNPINGKFSRIQTILNGSISDFKIIEVQMQLIMLILTGSDRQAFLILTWNEETHRFENEKRFYFNETYLQLEITKYNTNGIAITLEAQGKIDVYKYIIGRDDIQIMASEQLLLQQQSSMAMFNNYNTLYTVVQERRVNTTLIQPSCSLKIFRVFNGHIQLLQDLSVYGLVSINTLKISANDILISVISRSAGVQFYKFMGLAGLQPLHQNSLKLLAVKQLHFFDIQPEFYKSHRPLFVVLENKMLRIYHSKVFGDIHETNSGNSYDICSIR